MSDPRPLRRWLPRLQRSEPPADPPLDLARHPRPWLERGCGECAFPVDGRGWTTRSCCNPVETGAYCAAHAALMRPASKPPEAAR